MKKPVLFFLFVFTFLHISAQNRWQYSAGWAFTRSYAKADGHREVNIDMLSILSVKPRYSFQWPLGDSTGLTLWENIARLGILSFHAEKKLPSGLYFTTGIEMGGRSFDVTEYALNGRDDTKYFVYANKAHRSVLVTSIPLLLKKDKPVGTVNIRAVGGLYLNYGFSVLKKSVFYNVTQQNTIYPTLHLGVELCRLNNNGLVFEMAYQQGFFNAFTDDAVINSVLMQNKPPVHVPVSSKGSYFKVGLRYNFSRREKTAKVPTAHGGEIPFKEREISRTITYRNSTGRATLCFYDDQTVDNDSITVTLNDSILLEGHRLTAAKKCIEIDLSRPGTAEVMIHALNEGSIKPNTLTLEYHDGTVVQKETLRLGLDNSIKIFINR